MIGLHFDHPALVAAQDQLAARHDLPNGGAGKAQKENFLTGRQVGNDLLCLKQRYRCFPGPRPTRHEQVSRLREDIDPLLVQIDIQDRTPNKSSSTFGPGGFNAASISISTFLIVAGSSSPD